MAGGGLWQKWIGEVCGLCPLRKKVVGEVKNAPSYPSSLQTINNNSTDICFLFCYLHFFSSILLLYLDCLFCSLYNTRAPLMMLNITRRGPASISSILRAVTSAPRIASTRPSLLSASIRNPSAPFAVCRTLHVSSQLRNYAAAYQVESSDAAPEDKNITKFDELSEYGMVHPNVINAITQGMKINTMTEVQTETINQALQGIDL